MIPSFTDIGEVGKISKAVIETLNLSVIPDEPIYIGQTNIDHMLSSHPRDYNTYGRYIPEIIARPDYVGLHPSNNSIEYVKDFMVEGEYVKVAVRVSSQGLYFVRSIYVLNKGRVLRFIAKGTLKRLTSAP